MNIKQISNFKNLVAAYELIKSNKGNRTPFPLWRKSKETLDGLSIEHLKRTQAKLRSGTFNFSPGRRIQIPKPGKNETRPLTIASPRDKLVQKAIQIVLEPTYEKTFLDCSHGFRPGKGTRSAMALIDAKFQSCHYIIEADFSPLPAKPHQRLLVGQRAGGEAAFDSIPHEKLLQILGIKITCTKTIRLIRSGLKAGFVQFWQLHNNLAGGTPQGSILSPLLCNVYLHELDKYMQCLAKEYHIGQKRGKNKQYEKLSNAVKYIRAKGQNATNKSKYKTLIKQLITTPSGDQSLVRIHYVRYADDFIVGVEGSFTLAKTILEKIELWIEDKLGLKLNPEKTKITKYSHKPVKFLGYSLMAPHIKGAEKPLERLKVAGRTISRRKKLRIRFYMDYEKVINRLKTNGIIMKRTRHDAHGKKVFRGTFRGNLVNLDHADILRYYNSILRGLYNYYNFVSNMNQLAYVSWLITESCCLTLARKFKLRTMATTFRKFGKDLGCNVLLKSGTTKRVSIFNPPNFKKQKGP
jgi:retron-type reverse transcriptase